MPEKITKDTIIRYLRSKYAFSEGRSMSTSVRESTQIAIEEYLFREGFLDKERVISDKGISFLHDNRLTESFKCEFSANGYEYTPDGNFDSEEIIKVLNSRPSPDYSLDHQPLLTELTIMRAHYLASEENLFDKKVAFIGDYDCTHIALSLITKVKELWVFDIDKRLIEFFQTIANKYQYNVNLVNCDLFEYDRSDVKGLFDVIVTDPPYALGGMNYFVEFGIDLLKDGGRGYIAAPYHTSIDWTETMLFKIVELSLAKNCIVNSIFKYFHRYQTADGLQSSMIGIKKGVDLSLVNENKLYSYKKENINIPIFDINE